jgi:mono/diheme cytochrome c family protein
MIRFIQAAGLLSLFIAATGQASEPAKGKALVEGNCVRCHGPEVYTRSDRRITNLPGLHKQVRRCEQMLGLTWFDDEIDEVANYLNQQYYKFDKTP